jgi:two-component system, response regulator PdtaR
MTKILVVDDDLLVLATISMGLKQAGYQVAQASSGIFALQACRESKPDLALLDIRMPNMDGIEVAKVLGENKIPFIFLSAYGDEEIVKTAIEVGALGYLVKPLEIERIIPAIEVGLVRAGDLAKADNTIENLTKVLDDNREIDIAIGILMERHCLNRVNAFNKLRSYARSKQKKVVAVAHSVMKGFELAD